MYRALKGKHFLVVDDEPTTLEIVREVLVSQGAIAKTTTDPASVRGMMAKDRYDAVILDRYMPDADGHDILKAIKANPSYKDVSVVMLTGENKSSEIRVSIELGASGYVVKPFTPKELLGQLKRIFTS